VAKTSDGSAEAAAGRTVEKARDVVGELAVGSGIELEAIERFICDGGGI
jgi:hypothetical protein